MGYYITYRRQPHGFKTRLLGRDFYTFIKVSFSFPTNVGSHNPPPFRAQSPRADTHSFPRLIVHHPVYGFGIICNSPISQLADIVCFGPLRITVNLTVLKHVCYREIFTPLNRLFRSYSQPTWDLTIHPPLEPSVLADTHSFPRLIAHHPVYGFDTISNSPISQLVDIVRFGPLRIAVSLMILKHV